MLHVTCFYDNYSLLEAWEGVPVKKYTQKQKDDVMIVITTDIYMSEIEKQLTCLGLIKGRDFVPYTCFEAGIIRYFRLRDILETEEATLYFLKWLKKEKKLAAFYGNCQMHMVQRLMVNSKTFMDEFISLELPAVYAYKTEKDFEYFQERFWSELDLLISQRVKTDNRFSAKLATEYVETYLSSDVKCVWVPNVFFDGYFPQEKRNEHNLFTEENIGGVFALGDRFVDELYDSGKTADEIMEQVSREDFLSEDFVKSKVRESFDSLRKREATCDIVISDYLEKHYTEKVLFYCSNHPCNEVLIELSNRILGYLGVDETLDNIPEESLDFTLKGQDVPIYPSVKKALNLKSTEEKYYANRYYWDFCGDFIEFVRKYIQVCRIK